MAGGGEQGDEGGDDMWTQGIERERERMWAGGSGSMSMSRNLTSWKQQVFLTY